MGTSFRIGVDIGGTFTDVVLQRDDGAVLTRKVSTTVENFGRGIVEALRDLVREPDLDATGLEEVVHGTTVATNAILEDRGAVTALLTTDGFRDVLEFRRIRIPELYDLFYEKPPPLVPRRRRFEVPERMGPHGEVRRPLDEAGLAAVVERLRGCAPEAVAICLLHSYVNPAHEHAVEAAVRAALPGVYVTCSADLLPEIREYERTSTTVINAYVGPIVERYLRSLVQDLSGAGFQAPLLVMQSNGAVMAAESAMERPAHVIESGPAAGVTAGGQLARLAGYGDIITFDMGGTTAKASMIEGGNLLRTSEYEVGGGINLSSLLVKGGGYALKLPLIDVSEIGAGGGSIVWIAEGGLLQIGPRSAGASPGPVCYGLGGQEPTVTDANLLLGYLNPHHLAGGQVQLDVERAHRAFEEQVAAQLEMPLLEAAHGVFTLAATNMVRAVKAVSTYRGRDPRDFALLAFGGNGPLFGVEMARALGMARVIVPPSPGLFSAFGLLLSDVEHHFGQTLFRSTQALAPAELAETYARLEQQAHAALAREGRAERMEVRRLADLRYAGQAYEVTVPVAEGPIGPAEVAAMVEAFGVEHLRTYGHRATNEPVDLVNVRVIGRSVSERPRAYEPGVALAAGAQPPHARTRAVYFGPSLGVVETLVIRRLDLQGPAREGPLIVEEYDATCLVPPGCRAHLDRWGSIIIDLPLDERGTGE